MRGQLPDYGKLSFSQCGEDLIMQYLFNDLNIDQPSFIDIGAHHPKFLSNTYIFYLKGSRGINIEPDPELFQNFLIDRKEDKNLNIGIAAEPGEADFYIMNPSTLNTFVKEEAERINKEDSSYFIKKTLKIKLEPVAAVIQQYSNGIFPDMLSLDVEGMDEAILQTINYTSSVPKVICVESLSFSAKGEGIKNQHLLNYLIDKGYSIYADTFINTILVHRNSKLGH